MSRSATMSVPESASGRWATTGRARCFTSRSGRARERCRRVRGWGSDDRDSLANSERERKCRLGRSFARGEMPIVHLAKHAAFDAGVVDRGARQGCARDGAARVDRPGGRDAAPQRRVLLCLDFVASLKRAPVCDDDAPDLFRAEASMRNPGAAPRDAMLARARPGAVAGPRAAPRSAEAAAPGAVSTPCAEAAARALAPSGVQGARAKH